MSPSAAPPGAADEEELVQAHLGAPAPGAGPSAARPVRSAQLSPTEVHARPAALWQRVSAALIDGALVGAVVALFLAIASAVARIRVPETPLHGLDRLIVVLRAFEPVLKPTLALAVLLALLYSTAFAVLWGGRTIGRRLLGIQLLDAHGLPPTPARAAVRSLLSLLSFAVFLAGFWLALFDRRGQTLHDKLTSTFVVRRK